MITIRPVALDDAQALADLRADSREHLAPWEPDRDEAFFTAEGQREVIAVALDRDAAGIGRSYVIADAERPVGGLVFNSIVRGPHFRSCSLGYWVARAETGRGVATAAVGLAKRVAFEELGLRRVQAETLVHNFASQKVLERNGFEPVGLAPAYLKIAGAWQDHLLFQALDPARD